MKNHLPLCLTLLLGTSTAFSTVPQMQAVSFPPVSPPVAQFLKLFGANVPEDVLISYIQNFPGTFDLTPEEVIQLENDGVDSELIKEIFVHDHDWRLQENANYNTSTGLPPFESPPMSPVPDEDMTNQPTEPDEYSQPIEMPPEEMPPDESAVQPYEDENSQAAGFFYSSLAPYGSWNNIPGSGWCWQPNECQDRSWKPYCDKGQWFFTDCGWYWNSYYPWGWAPFHYGRWCNDPQRGWVWFPGKQWCAAWVTWRDCGQGIGWAPLPPNSFVLPNGLFFNKRLVPPGFGFSLKPRDFTFVDPAKISAVDLRSAAFGPVQAARIFAQTSVANNLSIGRDGKVVNLGLDVNLVAGDSSKPIIRANIKDTPNQQTAGYTPGSPGTLGTFRPQVNAQNDSSGQPQVVGRNNLPFATEGRMGVNLGSPPNQHTQSTSQSPSQPTSYNNEYPKFLSHQNTANDSQPNSPATAPNVAPTGTQFPQTIQIPQHGVAVPNVPTQHFNVGAPARGSHG